MKSFLLGYGLEMFLIFCRFQKLVSCYLQTYFDCAYLLLNGGALYFKDLSHGYACLFKR